MKLKDLLKKLFPDKEKEIEELGEIEAPVISKTDDQSAKSGITASIDAETKRMIEQLAAENKKLLDELAKRNEADKQREKLLEEKAQQENQAKIDALIQKAIEEKKLPAKDEKTIASFKKLLEADYESGEVALNALPKITDNGNGKTAATNQQPPAPQPGMKASSKILQNILETNQITN